MIRLTLNKATALLLAMVFSASLAPPVAAHHGKPHRMKDGLNQAERHRVLEAVRSKDPTLDYRERKQRRMARNNSFVSAEPELLLVERRPADSKTSESRTANVYYYDYQKDQTIHCIVDAESGEVHRKIRVRNLQLPLNDNEIQRAFDIYLQSDHRGELVDAYYQTTGQSLIDISKVQFKAYVFHASVNEALLNKKARRCGKTRCAQLLLYTEDNIAMNLSPVVSLSRGVVIQGNTLPGEAFSTSTAVGDHAHDEEH